MSRPAVLVPAARQDLREAVTQIARDNPEAARRLRTRLETALRRLGANPAIGAQRPALAEARYRFLSYQRFSLSAGLHSSAPVCAASVAMRLCFLLPFWNSYGSSLFRVGSNGSSGQLQVEFAGDQVDHGNEVSV